MFLDAHYASLSVSVPGLDGTSPQSTPTKDKFTISCVLRGVL